MPQKDFCNTIRLKADMINAEKFKKWFELPKADLAALAAKAKGK